MAASSRTTSTRAVTTRWRDLSKQFDGMGRTVLVVSSFTSQPIGPGIGIGLAEAEGRPPSIAFADYNQLFQVCLQPDRHVPDGVDDVIVIWRIEDVFERDFHAWSCSEPGAFDRLVEGVRSLAGARARRAATVRGAGTRGHPPRPGGVGVAHPQ
jgi:hypothetical protein